jgi:hypothetical protein
MFAVISLLQNDDVEVRLLRSAPGGSTNAVFGVFQLTRQHGACRF